MKIKRLKKIRIGSTIYNIEWDKKQNGASVSWHGKKLIIGIQFHDEVRIFENLIHEIKEIIQFEQMVRYVQPDAAVGLYTFIYNHDYHTDLCSRLAGILSEFII